MNENYYCVKCPEGSVSEEGEMCLCPEQQFFDLENRICVCSNT